MSIVESKKVFSVITVCYNEEASIHKTIESVLKQEFDSFEYIICDGGSTDNTLQIAQSYRSAFEKRGIPFAIHSEKDGGIYFGMNNGVHRAEGRYLNFMNAGDELHDEKVLYQMDKVLGKESVDILYGDIIRVERHYGKHVVGNIAGIEQGMSICHQAMFIKAELLREHPYNTDYSVVADYDFTLSMYQKNKRFLHADITVANFRAGGVSTTQVESIAREYEEIKAKAGLNYDYEKKLQSTQIGYEKQKKKEKIPMWIWALYSRLRGRKRYD